MSQYQCWFAPSFLKRLHKLARKYPHIKEDISSCLQEFQKENSAFLGRSFYKVRMKSQDITRGKSGSFRAVVYVFEIENLLVPVVLYFKGDRDSLSKREIIYYFRIILQEFDDKK